MRMIDLDNLTYTPKGIPLSVESDFLHENMIKSNGQEVLYASMLQLVDIAITFPAFYLIIPIVLLTSGVIISPLNFFAISILLYVHGSFKSISRLSFTDVFILFPLYYIFNKLYFIITVLLCFLLYFTGFTWAIPSYIILLIIGRLIKESILSSYAKKVSQKYDIMLSYHDIFLLRNLSRYAHNSYNLHDWILTLKKYREFVD